MAGGSIVLKQPQTLGEQGTTMHGQHAGVIYLSGVSHIGSRDQMAHASFWTCTNLHKTYQKWEKKQQTETKHKKQKYSPTHHQTWAGTTINLNICTDEWSINFNQNPCNTGKAGDKKGEKKDNDVNGGLSKEVSTVLSSSQSQISSIGIGEFSMKATKQGNAATFSGTVKFQLFKNVKFLQGPDASLDLAWMRVPFAD